MPELQEQSEAERRATTGPAADLNKSRRREAQTAPEGKGQVIQPIS